MNKYEVRYTHVFPDAHSTFRMEAADDASIVEFVDKWMLNMGSTAGMSYAIYRIDESLVEVMNKPVS